MFSGAGNDTMPLTINELDQITTAIEMATTYGINDQDYINRHNVICLLNKFTDFGSKRSKPVGVEFTLPEPSQSCVFVSTWTCKLSPNGYCEYNDDANAGEEECIHCGEPEERK